MEIAEDLENQNFLLKKQTSTITEVADTDRFYLTWENINLKIIKKQRKGIFSSEKNEISILNNVSGFARSGECLAIMGGSGAGKSTLLNIMAGKLKNSKKTLVSGKISLNGHPMDFEKYKNIIGFVLQKDIFYETMTVKEILDFVISLKQANLNKEEKDKKVKNLILQLKLEKAANNRVGGSMEKGISGGEKRRLNIGFELATDPKILFLDEPTSGLDSYTSFVIIKLLSKLARIKNILIIYTIHQPSLDVGNLFDNLCVLNKGKIMYFDKKIYLEEYLENVEERCALDVNPLDHIIDLSLIGGNEKDEKFFEYFKDSHLPKIQQEIEISKNAESTIQTKVEQTSFLTQFKILSKRAFLGFVRQPFTFKIRLFQTVFISIIVIMLFWRMDDPDPKNYATIQARLACLFFITVNLFFMYVQTVITVFPVERELFSKEYNSGIYNIIPYYLSKLTIEMPLTGVFPMFFIIIVYFAINFNYNVGSFFLTVLVTIFISWFSLIMGILIGSMISTPEAAIDVTPLILVPCLIFSGFTANSSNIINVLKFIEYLSPMRYFFELFVTSQFWNQEEKLGDFWPLRILDFNIRFYTFIVVIGYGALLLFLNILVLKIKSRNIVF
jgi:ABC-type multidrug transport system ATPase subunit/ABC-type multidrug transport system permease subunit